MGQEPYVVFDRRKPESYWDDFAVDVAVVLLPVLLFLVGLGVALALGAGAAFGVSAGSAEPGPRGRWLGALSACRFSGSGSAH